MSAARTGVSLTFAMAVVAPLAAQQAFNGSPIGNATLTQGAGSMQADAASTIWNLSDNSVIQWNTFTLLAGHELQFNFVDPMDTVVNVVMGGSRAMVNGNVSSNGNVVILSPNSALAIDSTAEITTASFVASGLNATPEQFFDGSEEIVFEVTAKTNPTTDIDADITTTRGGVLLVGKELRIGSRIRSAGPVTAITGEKVTFRKNAPTTSETSGGKRILQFDDIDAGGDISFITQETLQMTGTMRAGNGRGRFFAKVDDGQSIKIGQRGLTVYASSAEFSVKPDKEVEFIRPAEGDNPSALSPALNEFPSLSANRSSERTLPTSAAVVARAGTGFTKAGEKEARRRNRDIAQTVTPVRKRSFFRTRATVTAER